MNDSLKYESIKGQDERDVNESPRRQDTHEAIRPVGLESREHVNLEEISLVELWLKAKSILRYLWLSRILIFGITLLFALGGYLKVIIAKPAYRANLTFALEQGDKIGNLGGLASQFGFSIGGGGEGLGGENLLKLMTSRRIVQDVLLSKIYVEGDSVLLINQYVDSEPKLKAKWDAQRLYPIDARTCCEPKEDSALGKVVEYILEKSLIVNKFDKKLSLVSVSYTGRDPIFTGAFVELLSTKSTKFYVESKMANSTANIAKLEHRVDSVSAELQAAMVGYASSLDQNSYTVLSTAKVPSVQKQMKVTMLTTLYGELVKNLELSKTMAAREEPLITVIDRPHYPLRVRESKLKSAAIGGVLGILLTLLFLGAKALIKDLNKQEAAIMRKDWLKETSDEQSLPA